MGCLLWAIVLMIDFLITTIVCFIICLVLSAIGILPATFSFTWGIAFGLWIIKCLLKLLFGNNSDNK